MFLHVNSARLLDAYRVEVCFNDGRAGIVDLSESLEGRCSNLSGTRMYSEASG